MRRLVALVLVCGCDAVFRLDRLPDAALSDAPTSKMCAPGCECDDFAGTTIDPARWNRFSNNGILIDQDDALFIDMRPVANFAGSAQGELTFVGHWDLTGATVAVEVPQVIGGTNGNTENYVRLLANNDLDSGYVARYGDGQLQFGTRQAGVYQFHVDRKYDPNGDRFWQIAFTDTQVTFATRTSQGDAWRVEVMVPAAILPMDIQVLLVAGTYRTGAPAPGLVQYDNFEMCNARPL